MVHLHNANESAERNNNFAATADSWIPGLPLEEHKCFLRPSAAEVYCIWLQPCRKKQTPDIEEWDTLQCVFQRAFIEENAVE